MTTVTLKDLADSLAAAQTNLATAQSQLDALIAAGTGTTTPTTPVTGTLTFMGVNMGTMNNNPGVLPGVAGQNYFVWVQDLLAARVAKGMLHARAPFCWERVQSGRGMPFSSSVSKTYVQELHDNYTKAEAVGLKVIPDLHNYMRYKNVLISNDAKSTQPSLPDFWVKWWNEFGSKHNCFLALGLMNEPYQIDATVLFDTIQATVTALRNAGCKLPLLIPSNNFCSASTYPNDGIYMLKIVDPLDNLFFEVHHYLAEGGEYTAASVAKQFSVNAYIDLFTPAYDLIKAAGKRMFIGEFAWPKGSASAQAAGVALIQWAYDRKVPMTWWADGMGWPSTDLIALYNDNGDVDHYKPANDVRSLLDVLEPWFAKRLDKFM